jgi:hypothetical protein
VKGAVYGAGVRGYPPVSASPYAPDENGGFHRRRKRKRLSIKKTPPRYSSITEPTVEDSEAPTELHPASVNPHDWHFLTGTPSTRVTEPAGPSCRVVLSCFVRLILESFAITKEDG